MSTKEYLLTWQWKYNHTANSVNSLSTKDKTVVDMYLNDIKDNAVNIHLITYEQTNKIKD
jgi:hypothetical protein